MPRTIHYHYDKFPPQNLDWSKLIPLIGPASAALARYDGTLSAIPNAAVLLSPMTTQEAVLSSRIEGTQATMGEVLEYEAEADSDNIPAERKADINEVLNYRRAMWRAVELLNNLPLCQRVIKEIHSVLLDGVRGHGKAPGEYRKIPNWIGPPGCPMEEARFVPASADRLPDAMDAWEKYIHSEEVPDRLVQLAILHAEFEALHPFLDGNGRLGRMCVPLFMFQSRLIQSPMFYISAFFERRRDEYYDRLLAISRDDNWTGWCEFFLNAVAEQALENQQKAMEILNLYEDKKNRIVELTHSQYAIHSLDFIFAQPVFKATDFTNKSEIPPPTAKRILSVLRNNGVLEMIRESRGRRPAVYVFTELLNIAEGKAVF
ncbi:Fic family protein [Desulfonema ishimotonii]|uniref:Fic family protein n=1 Tax=Desulfonema ishimotonii TaxID=45657 RepID=A0A401G4J6_9BACT|nr:Fic/DOC family N-terminal domain-containing protein [Desulfonema ishimotonii]GBC64140.1 Fic family protein [Desulfonema ishimotonii]